MEKKDKYDLAIKIIIILGGIFSFFYGIHKYETIHKDESAKVFWSQQFPIYKELCKNAAIIATTEDSIQLNNSIEAYWRMYYGEARMVVDWQVHEKMSFFAKVLKDVERGFISRDELTLPSYELATRCRKSISESWDIPLSELKVE